MILTLTLKSGVALTYGEVDRELSEFDDDSHERGWSEKANRERTLTFDNRLRYRAEHFVQERRRCRRRGLDIIEGGDTVAEPFRRRIPCVARRRNAPAHLPNSGVVVPEQIGKRLLSRVSLISRLDAASPIAGDSSLDGGGKCRNQTGPGRSTLSRRLLLVADSACLQGVQDIVVRVESLVVIGNIGCTVTIRELPFAQSTL